MKCLNCSTKLSGKQTKFCCRDCMLYYNNHNLQSYANQKARGLNRKREFIKLAGGCCSKCGYNKNTTALNFHHLDPATKEFQLDERSLANRKESCLMAEFLKCVLLCANCHAEEHHPDSTL